MTPPEVLALAPPGRAPDTPGWRVRVVPNKFPAVARHEVVVHGPQHARSLGQLAPELLDDVAFAWQRRAEVARTDGVAYLHAFVNEGKGAGASLSHSHSQLAGLSGAPPGAADPLPAEGGPCGFCTVLGQELEAGARVVLERDGLVAACPFAGRVPYETVIAPVLCERDGLTSTLLAPALRLAGEITARLHRLEGEVPLNVWLRAGGLSGAHAHWRLEILPRLTVFAGLELGAGLYVNPLAPEEAAVRLRPAS
jgi:UDPglucose--hexose-1-phosphate uridylyltransferase